MSNELPVCAGIKAKSGKGDCQSDKCSAMVTSSTMMTTLTDNQPSDECPGDGTSPPVSGRGNTTVMQLDKDSLYAITRGVIQGLLWGEVGMETLAGSAERPCLGLHRIGQYLICQHNFENYRLLFLQA